MYSTGTHVPSPFSGPSGGECDAETQHRCPNSRCITLANVCDSFCDCHPDCSDEANCTSDLYAILGGVSRCEVGSTLSCMTANLDRSRDRCISPEFICDGQNDCHNGDFYSDEYGCGIVKVTLPFGHLSSRIPRRFHSYNFLYLATIYTLSSFKADECPGPQDGGRWFLCSEGRCISSHLLCDFHPDCLHGDDETDCGKECCFVVLLKTGRCVIFIVTVQAEESTTILLLPYRVSSRSRYRVSSFSKEYNKYYPACNVSEWRCSSGQCVPESSRCDLQFQCLDKSDEIACENNTCSEGQARCRNGQCLSSQLWCDWVVDCADGSDEASCDRPAACIEDEFQCSNGQCVPLSSRCDAALSPREGCADRSHLLNCSQQECAAGAFQCGSGPCVPSSRVCDGRIDCPLTWDDEDHCLQQIATSFASLTEEYKYDISQGDMREEMLHLKTIHTANYGEEFQSPYRLLNKVSKFRLNEIFPNVWDINEIFPNVWDINEIFPNVDKIFPNVCIVLRTFCTLPSTVASAERSFSKSRLIKNVLRSTVMQERLNDLAVLCMRS
ncbi:G-protein coupled receptor GRL101-like [Penaeus monodon]|uniref:G-protein coupled receptor GRL101-like n=1 Tax=Penaeus monodon TaxID=6687 RepID=UPI0018A7B03C|nr:G-protein coupled receptor GRL101-like [Penaeus monodon]